MRYVCAQVCVCVCVFTSLQAQSPFHGSDFLDADANGDAADYGHEANAHDLKERNTQPEVRCVWDCTTLNPPQPLQLKVTCKHTGTKAKGGMAEQRAKANRPKERLESATMANQYWDQKPSPPPPPPPPPAASPLVQQSLLREPYGLTSPG